MIRIRSLLAPALLVLAMGVAGRTATAQDAIPAATPTDGGRVFALPGEQVFPEGVTFQEGTGDFFVGSTTDGTIYRGNVETGELGVLVPGQAGRSAIGMEVDDQGRLFVAGGTTGLVSVYDAATGALVGEYSNGLAPNTFLNDVAIIPGRAVYVTDSFNPLLYGVPAPALDAGAATPGVATPTAGGTLEVFFDLTGTVVPFGEGINANGIVVTPDGTYLLLVHTATGTLYRIDVANREAIQVNLGGASLANGDGLHLDGRTLHVVRNADGLIVPVELSEDYATGTVGEAFTDPSFAFPTTIARYDGCLLVVNSQFNQQGGQPNLPFTVSSIPLPADAPPDAATPDAATPDADAAEAVPVAGGC